MRRFLRRIRLLFSRYSRPDPGNCGSNRPYQGGVQSGNPIDFPGQSELRYQAFNVTQNRVVASKVIWAGTSEQRRRGLLGRTALGREEGIYIVPTQWIHMFGMRFPIDVAFLAADGRILYMHHGLQPNRLSRLVWRADGALELASGTLREAGAAIGDVIELRSAKDMSQ